MHRFVGNFSYVGFLIAGWAGWRYLRTTREDDREYYDWMGHWGLIWGFGFLIIQPVIGYGYLKGIRESSPEAFNVIMLGSKAWVFNLLAIWLAVMSIASTAYFVHKLRFAVKPVEFLRKLAVGALDRKSTRLNSSHANISYAVFCLKTKKTIFPMRHLY